MSLSSSSRVRLYGCGHRMWTTWTLKNPGRRFLGCTNYNHEYINYGFFRWIVPQLPNKWYREKMYEVRAQANGEDVMLDGPPTLLSIFMSMKPRLKLLFKILMNMVMALELKVVDLESSSS
ncbi:unnamed protein product [Lactuca virosa]|uniref:Zinc finger GRF-type domain-containing protein n=1 Tax=Lactuca virosa TaxID=75947 RepID=A0AAU9MCY2_9ASTR|nr:unnamed protein product [Lactuca virosa]